MPDRTPLAAALLLAALTAAAADARAVPTYTVLDIGAPDNSSDPPSMQAMGLNSLGEVTGSYRLEDGSTHAFLYTLGIVKDLGTLGEGTMSVGIAVNSSSQVTGSSRVDNSSMEEHAFLHNGVFMDDLGTLGGTLSQGRGINANGEVTGEAALDMFVRHAFLFNGTFMDDLGVLGGSSSEGFMITNNGLIAGATTTVAGPKHAFLYDGIEMHDLGTLAGGFVSQGRGVNATGKVTGFSTNHTAFQVAFYWDGVTMFDLGTLGGNKSFGNAINADGLVVGTSDVSTQSSLTHAFVWDGTMHDLNDLVTGLAPGVTIELQSAEWGGSINDAGQIAATGRYLTGGPAGFHAFLLTPVPEAAPGACALIAGASLVALSAARTAGAGSGRRPDRRA